MSGDCDGLREAVDGSMEEARRLFTIMARMRSFLRDEEMALAAELLSPRDLERLWQREN